MSFDLTQFQGAFYEESFEAVTSMEEVLLRLDAGSPDPEIINTVFRVAHSIKGGSATFGFKDIASFAHTLETLLDELRARRMPVTGQVCDLLLRSVDLLRELLRAQQSGTALAPQRLADLQFDLEMMVAHNKGGAAAAPPPVAVPETALAGSQLPASQLWQIDFRPYLHLLVRGNDPLRMFNELRALGELQVQLDSSALPSLADMDPENCYLKWQLQLRTDARREVIEEVFDWAEGDCDLHITLLQPAVPTAVETKQVVAETTVVGPAETVRAAEPVRNAETASIRVNLEKIDELINHVGELVITQSMLSRHVQLLPREAGNELRAGLAQLERNVRELQESVLRVRMVPVSFVFSRFPRMVRDLCQRLGKQIELKLTGGDTELDKTVLEKIGDPLVHLVRNCVDHGIEMPDVRTARGKPARGTILLHAYHQGGNIVMLVEDDGGGLQTERILAKARERGLVAVDQQLGEQAIHDLIFTPGFSTTEQATELSGRGVGMDVVRRNVEELGGRIEVHSRAGQGSGFKITLPLSLAIVDGQTVRIGEESYIVPLTAIVESLQTRHVTMRQVVGRGEVLSFRNEYLPVVRLQQLFGARGADQHGGSLIMVVEGEGRRVGLCVDELLGQQQVVVKALDDNYRQVEGLSGATILGDGSVALILDVAGIARTVPGQVAA